LRRPERAEIDGCDDDKPRLRPGLFFARGAGEWVVACQVNRGYDVGSAHENAQEVGSRASHGHCSCANQGRHIMNNDEDKVKVSSVAYSADYTPSAVEALQKISLEVLSGLRSALKAGLSPCIVLDDNEDSWRLYCHVLLTLSRAGLIGQEFSVTFNIVDPVKRPIDYQEYLASAGWREKAIQAKTRAGHRCQVCNQSANAVLLDTHHRTYVRLGDEWPEDLIVLCRDCHGLFHENGRLAP
jgi:hypothetical protein